MPETAILEPDDILCASHGVYSITIWFIIISVRWISLILFECYEKENNN